MKKVILLLSLLLSLNLTAQEITRVGNNSRIGLNGVHGMQLAGPADGKYYAVFKINNGTVMVGTFSADKFKPGKVVSLNHLNRLALRDARISGNQLLLLLSGENDKETPGYYRAVVDLATLKMEGKPQPLNNVTKARRDKGYWWAAQSPDGKYTALMNVVVEKGDKVRQAEIVLLDEQFNPLWTRHEDMDAMNQLIVNNEGLVTCFSYAMGGDAILLRASAFLKDDAIRSQRQVDFTDNPGLWYTRAEVVREDDGRLLVVGDIIANPDGKITSKDVAEGNCCTRGCFAVCYDPVEDRILGSDQHLFTQEEFEHGLLFYNAPGRRDRQSKKWLNFKNSMDINVGLDYFSVYHRCRTPYGAAFNMQARHSVITQYSNGGSSRTDYVNGNFIYAVDTLGHFLWNRIVPSMVTAGNASYCVSSLYCVGDQLYYVQNECAKSSPDYDPLRIDGPYSIAKAGNVGIYTFAPDGTVGKRLLCPKSNGEGPMLRILRPDTGSPDRCLLRTKGNNAVLYKLDF